MRDRTEQLTESISVRLDEIEARIRQIREAAAAARLRVARAVQAKLDEATQRAAARNIQFQHERARVNAKVKRGLAGDKTKIEQWKTSHDSKKLARHADRAEQYALAAIMDASDAIDEVEIAALGALDARLTADEAGSDEST